MLRRKPLRAQVAQPTVRPQPVVSARIICDHHSCFRQRPQLFPIQTFVPKPAMKALHKAVLPRTGRLNVDRFDVMLGQPPLHNLRDELRAVVRPQIFGAPCCSMAFCNQLNTSSERSARSARNTWHSRVCSSRIVSILKAPPRTVASAMKSHVQTDCGVWPGSASPSKPHGGRAFASSAAPAILPPGAGVECVACPRASLPGAATPRSVDTRSADAPPTVPAVASLTVARRWSGAAPDNRKWSGPA